MTENPPPPDTYTSWFIRVVAFVIDWAPIGLVWAAPFLVMIATGDTQCLNTIYFGGGDYQCAPPGFYFWLWYFGIALLLVVAYPLWNYGYRQGKTGQSVGKSIMGFRVVSEKTWQPIGFWPSALRQLAHNIDVAVCYLGYLLPLVDRKRQTIADKIMSTVCVPIEKR